MTKIIELLAIISIFAVSVFFLTKISKRLALFRVMKRLSKTDGIEIKRIGCPILSLVRFSKTPEYIMDIFGERYYIRCYNGGGVSKSVHFANGKFSVRYSHVRSYYYRPGVGRIVRTRGFNLGAAVKIIPEIQLPKALQDVDFREILIFNPAPTEVSYVVKEKNSIRAAFTGDVVYGRQIFTASTFEIFADREARRIKTERCVEK